MKQHKTITDTIKIYLSLKMIPNDYPYIRNSIYELNDGYININTPNDINNIDTWVINKISKVQKILLDKHSLTLQNLEVIFHDDYDNETYQIKINDKVIADVDVLKYNYLIGMGGYVDIHKNKQIGGIKIIEPVFGINALLIKEEDYDKAIGCGVTIISPIITICTHLSELLKKEYFKDI